MARKRRGKRARETKLHGDGVVGVLGDVPTRPDTGVREERAGARDILFRTNRVDLILDFVVFRWDG